MEKKIFVTILHPGDIIFFRDANPHFAFNFDWSFALVGHIITFNKLKKHLQELSLLPREDRCYYEGFLRKKKTKLMGVLENYFEKKEADVLRMELRRLTEK